MRRVAVLIVLFGVMFALQALRVEFDAGGRNPMTLAAIGFVLLASFTLAEVGSALSLPRVTGYILAGVALGPSVANILSSGVVKEMRMFNALALGLIATGAGLELDVRELARVFKTLLGTIALKVALGVTLVGGVFVLITSFFSSLGLGERKELYAIGLVLGVLSVGTSPAIALAVKTESRARGRLTDLVLGAAVLKDLVVVVALAVAVALARGWVTPDQVGEEPVLSLVAKEIASSLAAGAALGLLLILYIRFVKAEMLLFVAAMILVVSEVGRSLHLELLLVFITAGAVVRNLSKYEHELMPAVQLVALPVFIVFFTIAGASVDLRSTLGILPVAFALALVRAIGYKVAARVGGRFGGETELVQNRAWLGYLPQAGVTLGLVGLAAQQLPTLAERLHSIGMAVVAINLLVGPVALKRVLKEAGESHESVPEDRDHGGHGKAKVRERAPALPEPEPRALGAVVGILESPVLRKLALELHDALWQKITHFREAELQPWLQEMAGPLEKVLAEANDEATIADALHAWTAVPHAEDLPRRAAACERLFRELRAQLTAVEANLVLPLERSNRQSRPLESWRVRLRRWRHSIGRLVRFGAAAKRRVPARLVARLTLEPRLAKFALGTLSAWSEAQAVLLTELKRARRANASAVETQRALTQSLERFTGNFAHHARLGLLAGFEDFTASLALVGGPALPASSIRLSRVEPGINQTLARLRADPASWKPVLEGKQAELRAELEIERLVARIRHALEESVLHPAVTSVEVAGSVLASARGRLLEVRDEIRLARELDDAQRGAWSERVRRAFSTESQRRLAQAAARFRSAATVGSVAREIRFNIEALPATVPVPHATRGDAEPSPATYHVKLVELRQRVERILIETLFPTLDEQLREVFSEMAVTGARIREAVEICQHALDVPRRPAEGEAHLALERAFERALSRLDEQVRALESGQEHATSGVRERADAAFREIDAVFEGSGEVEVVSTGPGARWGGRAWRLLRRPSLAAVSVVQFSRRKWSRLLGSDLSKDVRLRYQREGTDATLLRSYVQRLTDINHVPTDYAKLWSAEPVREHRMFTANRDTLRDILATERASFTGGRGSLLLVGRSGSGRTSLLNLCEVELSAPRVIRPEPLEWRRTIGVARALAIELGLGDRVGDVAAALREVQTTVLIDDVVQWFTPDPEGVAELARFLELVVATDDHVFWLVAIEQSNLALLEEVVPIRPAFSHVVNIPTQTAEELASVLEARHAPSGRAIVYPNTATSALLSRFGRSDRRSVFFRTLARASGGSLSAAILEWLRAARVDGDGAIAPELYLDLRVGLALLAHLPARQLAILFQLVRFGPFDEAELSQHLELPVAEVGRHVHFFLTAGVLFREPRNGYRLCVVQRLKPIVLGALREAGVLR